MKRSALKYLVCPQCKDALELRIALEEGSDVMEGSLRSPHCGRSFEIVRGVPRFVASGAYASSFGYQWNRFSEVQIDSLSGSRVSEETLDGTSGWKEVDYSGSLVLDAGVGAGRFAEIAARRGATVFGIDLTNAVDAAFATLGRHENVHLCQADIFAMPFRDATFDLAYSIGVLHHTPDPPAAFARVAATVKPGGGFAVYLYASYGASRRFSDAIRVVTTRLPLPVMLGLSALAVPAYYVYRIPVLRGVLNTICPINMNPDWRWRWLDTFDWYTPKYQFKYRYPEVFRWFRETGFVDVQVFDDPIRMSGSKARLSKESAA
jgi:SAM-dependent methyltransferase